MRKYARREGVDWLYKILDKISRGDGGCATSTAANNINGRRCTRSDGIAPVISTVMHFRHE